MRKKTPAKEKIMTQKRKNKSGDIMQIKNVVAASFAICALCGLAGMFFTEALPWWGGAFFGLLINLLCFRLHYLNIEKSIKKDPKAAKYYSFTTYAARYIIKGFAIYASIKSPYLNWVSCVIGLLSINAAIHVLNILNIIFAKSKERE